MHLRKKQQVIAWAGRIMPAMIALLLALSLFVDAQAQPPFDAIVVKDVMVPMRDGIRLATDIYRPAREGVAVDDKFPVIMERTPYDKARSDWLAAFVKDGYVVVAQDTRGRFHSEGRWRFLADDVNDGFDTAKWLGGQSWCSCKIGTIGGSYPGGTQHALAISGAPFLAAMVPIDAVANAGYYGLRHNGAFELRFFNWIFTFGARDGSHEALSNPRTKQALEEMSQHVNDYVKGLPLRAGTTPLKLVPDYETWLIRAMNTGDLNDDWKNFGASVVDHVPEYKDIPVYHVGGWYDSWAGPTANMTFVALAKTKHNQRLIMGPWTHGGAENTYSGEAEFGPEAQIKYFDFAKRWFDRWLKGISNGVDKEAPVRLFVMGGGDAHKTAEGRLFVGGHWRDERQWPLTRAIPTNYYFGADGTLSTRPPQSSEPDSFLFDPRHPVPTLGGNISSSGTLTGNGALDQRCRADYWPCEGDTRPLSARDDILVFQTPPLDHDLEATGRLNVKLWASSSAPDTDFTAKLIDVYPPNDDFPAGVDLNVADSIVRARYHNSLEKSELMKPGQVYQFTIEMYPTSLVFKRGHRIRVDISSSNFPRFDVNPNTGEPLNQNRRWTTATNAVYHDPQHPSHLELPIIAAGK
ncbi:MAG TPA: CocE/NonD family hydrolase [Thermoanaerobaculia bacterium]|nr:CocE/NonD family hydrolase [Thermoanaerobaculia bacterium]